jgi:hypothetical protein
MELWHCLPTIKKMLRHGTEVSMTDWDVQIIQPFHSISNFVISFALLICHWQKLVLVRTRDCQKILAIE